MIFIVNKGKVHNLYRGDSLKPKNQDCIRLDPEEALCPAYDSCSIKKFAAPDREEMGVCVVDNFPEEHIQ